MALIGTVALVEAELGEPEPFAQFLPLYWGAGGSAPPPRTEGQIVP